jgi:hypothetical protein
MLFRLRPSDISGPLTQFQAATFEKDEVFRVLKSVNNAAGEVALEEARLHKVFTSFGISSIAIYPLSRRQNRRTDAMTIRVSGAVQKRFSKSYLC